MMTKNETQKYLLARFQAGGFQNIPLDEIASELDHLLKIVLNGALTKKGKRFLNNKLVPINYNV